MKGKVRMKKGIAWLMTAVMMFTITPVMTEPILAQAETTSTKKTIAGLGTSVIAAPTEPTSDEAAWTGSYVYYGNYDADGDGTAEPVKYRVLDASTTEFGETTMLLDCDSILYETEFHKDGSNQDWICSDIGGNLNGPGFFEKTGVFTKEEKFAIEYSVKEEASSNDGDGAGDTLSYASLYGYKIFLLDAKEVTRESYGYSNTINPSENRKKTGSSQKNWWLRSPYDDGEGGNDDEVPDSAGNVNEDGSIYLCEVEYSLGVSPAMNLRLSSVLFSSVISGTAGEPGAEYKLTLLDDEMSVELAGSVERSGNAVTIPYTISGKNSGNATQFSILILDKEYTAGNTNGASVLAYEKLNVADGNATYTLPNTISYKKGGEDYYAYIIAEDVNREKETDYASEPVAITIPERTERQMNFGTQGIIDPAVPNSASDPWTGCYVYYGNYNGSPVKYRVLDASTTDYSADGTTNTMLLDCDSILYYQRFDNDGTAHEEDKKVNDWSVSDMKSSLNGGSFLNKEGVFTTAEKNAIAASTVDTHTLTTDSETGVNVTGWTQSIYANYVALNGEQIFLLDAEDVSNGSYGYSMTNGTAENGRKTGSSVHYWWLRSAYGSSDNFAGCVCFDGSFGISHVFSSDPGVSPALNLNLSSVIFSSASAQSDSGQAFDKSLALTSESNEIGTVANTEWKLTLKDDEKSVALTEGRSVTKASDGTITVPYTYTDKEEATDREKVNQISVMITDKAYGSENTQILYYGALQDIKNAEGNTSPVAEASTGTGTFALPSSLTGTLGTDYHIYLLAEHVNADNSTDYASEPKEVTTILNEVDTVAVPSIDTPTAEQPLQTEITVSSEGAANTATLAWKKNDTEATGNAQWKTTYQAYVTLTAADGYTFVDAKGNVCVESATLNGSPVKEEDFTGNEDGTLTVYCGECTTATRKTTGAEAPEVPTQFANYYTADDVLSSTELGKAAKVTLEGTTQPNPKEMEVEWAIVDAEGNATTYNVTPTATNTFKWTVKASEYANYDKGAAVLEGTVAIKNKDYTPVTISGSDKTLTYNGSDTLDVSQYFIIDENAGTPTYELSDASTGTGTLDGATLTMTTLGTFVVKVSTPINDVYNKGEHTLTITVNKATPNVAVLPTVDNRAYHPTIPLVNGDLKDGTVYGVDGKALAGTWSWKEADIVPNIDNDGYLAVFTPEDTVHYQSIEKTISVNVSKATPYIKTKPTAAITYGEEVGASVLSGGVVQYSESDETTVAGTFAWKEAAAKPTVADSGKTEYVVIFKPTDKANYNEVETKITLTVNKAEVAPNKPESTMNTVYTNDTVGKVTLPEGWVWQDADKSTALTVGSPVTATAVYDGADKGNYLIESVEISITRLACTHATTEIRDAVAATCTVKGYTGDTYCKDCGVKLASGKEIEMIAHKWDAGKVTKEATETVEGVKTYTCSVCGKTKTEAIPKKTATTPQPPKKGAVVEDDKGTGDYKVTDATKKEVAYQTLANKKLATISVPATVKIGGVTYKVTSIADSAFVNNKKITKVTIGSNITTIGKKAFYKCTKLKKITIPSKVKKISKQVFYGCEKLKNITIKTTKLTSKNVGSKAFKGIYAKATIKVPKSKLKSYKKLLKARGVGKKAKIKK